MNLVRRPVGHGRLVMMGRVEPMGQQSLPEDTIPVAAELLRNHGPDWQHAESGPGEEEAVRIDVVLAITFVPVDIHQRTIKPMDASRGGTDRGPRLPMKVDHRLDVVGRIPVVGVEEGDGVELLLHR